MVWRDCIPMTERKPIPPLAVVHSEWKSVKTHQRFGQYFMNQYRVVDDKNELWEANEELAIAILSEMYVRYQWS